MKRIAIAAVGVFAALAALAHCGGTTGRDSPVATLPGDATVGDMLDAGLDVYTNQFDVALTYADQELPDVQAPPMNGGGDSSVESFGVPDCPPFIYVDGTGKPVTDCDPASTDQCLDPNFSDEAPADWTDGGETIARPGDPCATYPWLGTLANDECATSNYPPYNALPPCNWAREAGAATQGTGIGRPRYDLCMELYTCFMRTKCFIEPNPSGIGLLHNPKPCFCQGSSATTCVAEAGPCFNEELAAMEGPGSTPESQAVFAIANFAGVLNTLGIAGSEGANLNNLFEYGLNSGCFPQCTVDAGLDCGP